MTMKLSEAIRLGSSMIPEGVYYSNCAIGAAVAAIGKNFHYNSSIPRIPVYIIAEQTWPWLLQTYTNPKYGNRLSAKSIIGNLNGFFTREGQWSRTHIADWVATIEPQENVILNNNGADTLCQQECKLST